MNTLFGLSMDSIMVVTLGLFAVITAAVLVLAARHRLLVALALRNIPRRRAQTTLIIVGLMLGTVIITAAFGVGDTTTYSIRSTTAHNLGAVDEIVAGRAATPYNAAFVPASLVNRVRAGFAPTIVDGVTGAIVQSLALQDLTTRQTKAAVVLLGVPAGYPAAFGPLTSQDGAAMTLGQLGADQVYINAAAQQALGAHAGDRLHLFIGGQRVPVTVRDVLRNDNLAAGGLLSAGSSADPEIVMPLDRVQALLGRPGQITDVFISNRGDALAGAALTDQVTSALQAPLANPAQVAAAGALLETRRGRAALRALLHDRTISTATQAKLRNVQAQLGTIGNGDAAHTSMFAGLLDDADVIGALRTIKDPAIAAPLNTALAAISDYRVQAVKKLGLDQADQAGNGFLSIFLVFGLFSIAVGLLLIFLIFVMLAAERRAEMGMARAVGTKRRHLIEQFLFEGYAYDLGAALVGIALGIAVGLGMVSIIASLVGQFGFALQPHIALRSVVVAFCLGAVVTFMTVAFSAWRVSRLNIVAAIRDLPEDLHVDGRIGAAFRRPWADLQRAGRRVRGGHPLGALKAALVAPWHLVTAFRVFISRGPLLLVVGYLFLGLGIQGKQLFPFDLGISHLVIGGAMLVRWLLAGLRVPERIRNRAGYSLAGLGLVIFWLLPSDAIRSDLHSGMEMFFLSGLMLILGGVWTVMYNSDLLLGGLLLALGRIGALAPVLKTAVMYPLQNRFRTGLTLSMFSLVIFTLMLMSVLTGSYVGAGFNLDRDSGGYQVYGRVSPLNPIRDAGRQIAATPSLRGRIEAVGGIAELPVGLRQPGQKDQSWQPASAHIADDTYLASTRYVLHVRATGFSTDAQVWQAVRTHPGYAVVGAELVRAQGAFGPSNPFLIRGISYDGKSFAPVRIVMRDARSGTMIPLTIVGVLDQTSLLGSGVYTVQSTLAAAHDAPVIPTTFYFRVAPGQDVHRTALALGSAFLANGLDVTEVQVAYDKQTAVSGGITTLLQGFMALGLIVGIAALGVIATRAVVERRQQIGVLRAIGYRRRMVQASFLLESSFVSLMGTALGVVLGLLLARQVVTTMTKTDPSIHLIIPWVRIVGIVLLAYVASLLTTYLPARQAARIAPAEALRYE